LKKHFATILDVSGPETYNKCWIKREKNGGNQMALSKKPVNGMKDILPAEMEIRDYVTSVIKDTYRSFGFTPIETPCMENIANLSNKQGGENEKLIFKVLKRGEKLNLETAKEEADVVDFGMRYDLTVPLSRFYANHANDLPTPFKALQIGSVWRADRPQRGRYRQFTQCDIDILGEPSNLAEIELITATTTTIGRLGFKNFEIRINERRILKAMAAYSGFEEKDYDSIFITLDKMDKIGLEGVAAELEEEGYAKESIDKYLELFELLKDRKDVAEGVAFLKDKLGDFLDQEVADSLTEIATAVNATKNAEFTLVFDPTLVRGMSYYTGTIFEIAMPELGAACGGGGRYDKMIGKFTGNDVPACGFSIGFERIILLLMESGFKIPERPKRVAYLVEKKYPAEKLVDVMKQAKEARENGQQVLVVRMNKNKKFQKEQLSKEGYEEFEEFFNR
jgi:histidyl-tRNA synthetase